MTILISINLFARAYGGAYGDEASSVLQTSEGYLAVGYTNSMGEGDDALILKLSGVGTLEWAKAVGGDEQDLLHSVSHCPGGGFFAVGYTRSFGSGGSDFLVLKLSADGSLEWARAIGGPGDDGARRVVATPDGGCAVVGYTESFGFGAYDFLVLKLSADGSLEWARACGGAEQELGWGLTTASDGGLVVAGMTRSFGSGGSDFLVLKLSADGSLEWAKTYGGYNDEVLYSLCSTEDGGFVLTGTTLSFGAGNDDVLVVKISSGGSLQWSKCFGGSNNDVGLSVCQSAGGGLAVAGWTESLGTGRDAFVLGLSPSGSLEWAATLGNPDLDLVNEVKPVEGGLVLAGGVAGFGVDPYEDFLVLTLEPNGNYPNCVQSFSFSELEPNTLVQTPSLGTLECEPNVLELSPSVADVQPNGAQVCDPLGASELRLWRGLECLPTLGGLVFRSDRRVRVDVFSLDGRLLKSLWVKGAVKVPLRPGLYVWRCGGLWGRAIVGP